MLLKNLVIFLVHRRIGGLENTNNVLDGVKSVHRRIGGLENCLPSQSCALLVHRRIGGLEITAQ